MLRGKAGVGPENTSDDLKERPHETPESKLGADILDS
jgi:hypothetical protein